MAAYLNGCGRKKKWSWKISEKDCSNGGESDCHTDLNDLYTWDATVSTPTIQR